MRLPFSAAIISSPLIFSPAFVLSLISSLDNKRPGTSYSNLPFISCSILLFNVFYPVIYSVSIHAQYHAGFGMRSKYDQNGYSNGTENRLLC